MRRRVAAGIAVAVCLVARAGEASPEDIFGYGPRSPAMGATGVASSTGFEAAYTNPALLSRIREKKLTLGLFGATFDLHARGPDLPDRVSAVPAQGVVIGADVPIPFGGILRDRVAAGLAFYTPKDVIVRGRILYPETPQFPLLPDRAQSLAIRLGVGADVGYGVRVGAGFAALAEIAGDVLVATDATGRVGSRVEDQLVATYAPVIGASWDLPWGKGPEALWRVGLTYRGQLDARFAVSIDATKLSSLAIPVFNIAGLAQFDPAELALEVAREQDGWTFAGGGVFKRWSSYPGPIEPTIICPADNPDCGALTPPKVDFHDTVVLRAGVERAVPLTRAAKGFLRGGAFWEPSPAPSSMPSSQAFDPASRGNVDVPTRFFDADRVAITLGGGVALADPLPPISLDVFGQMHFLLSRHVDTPPAAGADVSGHVLAVGLNAGVRF